MDERLKQKIHEALSRACLPDDKPDIRLEDTGTSHLGGAVISPRFKSMPPSARQDLIWEQLDKALTPFERTLITFLLTETPEEFAVVRQFPSLDAVSADEFARAVRYRVGDRADAAEIERLAHALAHYAKTGEGLSAAEAKHAVERIAKVIEYAPLARAPEDGFGIVLLGASGRARLKQREPVTAKELHVLATLSRGQRAPISSNARDGEVTLDEALKYLSRRGIAL
jgi:hypothetical protein